MAWVIQCPKHGVVLEDYHFEAIQKLEIHSNEDCGVSGIKTLLYEKRAQTKWEAREECLLDSKELQDN